MRQKDRDDEKQWNGQNLKKLKYFESEVEQFQRNMKFAIFNFISKK